MRLPPEALAAFDRDGAALADEIRNDPGPLGGIDLADGETRRVVRVVLRHLVLATDRGSQAAIVAKATAEGVDPASYCPVEAAVVALLGLWGAAVGDDVVLAALR